jgi:heme/copper-type cytochrome/quinol oxidase subunit 2
MDRISKGFACGLLLIVGAGGCAGLGGQPAGFDSDVSTIQVVTTQVGGKNVFIPSTIVVTGGVPHTLSIFNTTDTPHGFRIPGLGIEAVAFDQQETEIALPALEGGHVYAIQCHLHPPHRTATLVVLPPR